jgi:5-methylcytosine-specific restriction endonuclease McrBC regulatory subunit McrC
LARVANRESANQLLEELLMTRFVHSNEGIFQLRPDLVLTCRSTDKQVIVDAKYKKRYGQEQSRKAGIGAG